MLTVEEKEDMVLKVLYDFCDLLELNGAEIGWGELSIEIKDCFCDETVTVVINKEAIEAKLAPQSL